MSDTAPPEKLKQKYLIWNQQITNIQNQLI